VLEAVYDGNGNIQRFAADVEQHCEDRDAALFAAIRYNSTVSNTTPFGGQYPQYKLSIAQPSHGRVEATRVRRARPGVANPHGGPPESDVDEQSDSGDSCRSADLMVAVDERRNRPVAVPLRAPGCGTPVFRVVAEPLGAPFLSADVRFPVAAGMSVTWTANVPGGTPPLQYQFSVWRSGVGWSLGRDFSPSNTFTWTAPADGTYVVQLLVRNGGTVMGYDGYTNSGYFNIASNAPARFVSVSANVLLPAHGGTSITWTALASGGTAGPLQFQFARLNQATGVWSVVQPYSTSSQFTWNTSLSDVGDYLIQVWVRSAGSAAGYEDWGTTGYFSLR
jgi:hypothetical protein